MRVQSLFLYVKVCYFGALLHFNHLLHIFSSFCLHYQYPFERTRVNHSQQAYSFILLAPSLPLTSKRGSFFWDQRRWASTRGQTLWVYDPQKAFFRLQRHNKLRQLLSKGEFRANPIYSPVWCCSCALDPLSVFSREQFQASQACLAPYLNHFLRSFYN